MDEFVITDIQGLDELEEAFTEGSRRALKVFLRRVEMRAAKILQTAVSDNAPYQDGELAASIKRTTVETDGALTVRVGPSRDGYYGLFQEFGAPEANVPALHWMENGARSVQDEVLQEFFDGITEGLQEMKK